jgi:predicted acylesterase/phospholipase RssA
MSTESASLLRARAYIRGEWAATPDEILALAEALHGERNLRHGRKVLSRARRGLAPDSPLYRTLGQQHALHTYEDPDLPATYRLDRACAILEEVDPPAVSTDQRTLGLAGAIETRLYEAEGQSHHLHRALGFYLRAYELGIEGDRGESAVNAAYVLDLLAHRERTHEGAAGCDSSTAEHRALRAEAIRRELTTRLPGLPGVATGEGADWRSLTTVAEAFFGIGDYRTAGEWLERAMRLEDAPGWKREATARQLASLALMREGPGVVGAGACADCLEPIRMLLGDHRPALNAVLVGKVGLALSGGGFRASFFHLGVLARLAELDLLRNVEVLSTVSGGSVVGVHYYLELKQLLESSPESEITRDDYVQLVRRVAENFLLGVQRNVRMRVLAELSTNLKMVLFPNYSRTMRAGELYEREIYSRVADGKGGAPRYMDDLMIQPAAEAPGFSPRRDNWRRVAKVPILVVNATSLNTGHNWQFTAAWMGEPPGEGDGDVDRTERHRRMFYGEAPERYRRMRLGHAVAASAGVPGLFDPLELPGLYPDRVVRLVDGGVHDNQGIATLLEQDCRTLIVSDASGQMDAEPNPKSGILGVLLRSNDVLMGRVREEQHQELEARRRSAQMRGVLFLHLKRALPVHPIDWKDCPEPFSQFAEEGELEEPVVLPYGLPTLAQRRLAGIRTDLDSFCDAEAYALMLSGYRMTEHDLPLSLPLLPAAASPPESWAFLAVEGPLLRAAEEPRAGINRILEVASNRLFKAWRLIPPLQALAAVLLLLAVGGGVGAYMAWGSGLAQVEIGSLLIGVATILIAVALGPTLGGVARLVRYRKAPSQVLVGVGMALGGWLIARVQLHLIDPIYLRWGSIDRVIAKHGAAPWFPIGVKAGPPTAPESPVVASGSGSDRR